MILIRLIRWILGYVIFTAKDGFKERFLNLCAMSKIPLWNVKNMGDYLIASTTIGGYKKIKSSAKRAQMKLKINKKIGLPFFINKNKKRFGLLIGITLMIIVISVLSTMLWTIDVEGNVNVTSDEILSVFEDLGVRVGCFKRRLDIEQIELEASQRLQDLSWLSLNIKGGRAVIEVREATKSPNIKDPKLPCNIVAGYDGQIIKYEVYSGKPMQEINAAVVKGDLLISGIIENQDETERFVHAKGNIIASTQRKISGKGYSIQLLTRVSEVKKVPGIYFFGIELPLWFNLNKKDSRPFKNEHLLNTGSIDLPIGTVKKKWIKLSQEKEEISDEQKKLIAINNYFHDEISQTKNAKIISQKVEVIENENNIEVLGILKCEEQIGKEQKIYIDID